ncbi:MAG TPA: hypothetical protein DCQ06_06760 [Myxococcales bacterium]|nr:hypothetical protein [Myxococcales bacterium]HAN31284.1 hypothetical protein [Myxococcales bacterium]
MSGDLLTLMQGSAALSGLNDTQRGAVLHSEGPLLVLAGAGSGKTRVITHRIAHLVRELQVAPWQILAVTFSNKAASEMRHRVGELLGAQAADLWLGTFHRTGLRMLRSFGQHGGLASGFTIYDRDDQKKMLKRAMAALNISDQRLKPKVVANFIDRAKNQLKGPDAVTSRDPTSALCAQVYSRYEADMKIAGAVDFGDLLMRPVQILQAEPTLMQMWSGRFKYILVDEFQDTNHAQMQLLQLLSSEHRNLCVVGDDDQSIYSWRGADVSNILDFPKRFEGARVVKLERNYRSTAQILAASGAIVSQNASRHAKTLWTDQKDGSPVHLHGSNTDLDEARWVVGRIGEARVAEPLSEMAIFYRTNSQSRVLEDALRSARIPYVVIGGLRFYDRAEVKDGLGYLKLVVNPDDTAAWLRVVNTPRRGIGKKLVERVADFAAIKQISMPEAARQLSVVKESFRGQKHLKAFTELMAQMRADVATKSADTAGVMILRHSGLIDALSQDPSIEAESRLDNLNQLVSALTDYTENHADTSLGGYLEQVSLVTDIDKLDKTVDAVSLMTMHAAKGLEFNQTFVCGLERNLMPHGNIDDEAGIEEERRLLYVAMTRARKRMYLTYARRRQRFNEVLTQTISPFLAAIPRDAMVRTGQQHQGWGAPVRGPSSRKQAWARAAQKEQKTNPPRTSEEVAIQRGPVGPFLPGSRARHVSFGEGEVLAREGHGKLARVTIRFHRVGVKKVLARFLQAL